MSKTLYLTTLLLMTACTFDPSGLPSQPANDATVDGNTGTDASGADAMADASIPDAPLPDAPLPACATDPLYVPNPTTGRRYRYYNNTRTFNNASGDCETDGAHIAVIDDEDENDYVDSLSSENLWLGATDSADEGVWITVTGAPLTYTNWRGGEPNDYGIGEDCIELYNSDGTWNDEGCSDSLRFVCECDPSITVPEL